MKKCIDKASIKNILHKLWKKDTGFENIDIAIIAYNRALQDVQKAIDSKQEEPVSEDKMTISKAKEQALKAYPLKMDGDIFGSYDLNLTKRTIYQQGYEQAEKDKELTWKDLKLLQNISHGIFAETANGRAEFYQVYPTEQSFFEEVLKRFKERKEK